MDISNISEAMVYVGTYSKYNNGNLTGDWLKFSDYSDSEEFFEACNALHSNETDIELMFQDSSDLPEELYSETLTEKQVDKIYEIIELAEKIESWGDSEWLEAHNTYLQENDYEGYIYDFDEDFFNTYFENRPMEAARATHFGQINWNDSYIKFNGYANLESISHIMSEIDQAEIITDMLENPRRYNI